MPATTSAIFAARAHVKVKTTQKYDLTQMTRVANRARKTSHAKTDPEGPPKKARPAAGALNTTQFSTSERDRLKKQ